MTATFEIAIAQKRDREPEDNRKSIYKRYIRFKITGILDKAEAVELLDLLASKYRASDGYLLHLVDPKGHTIKSLTFQE